MTESPSLMARCGRAAAAIAAVAACATPSAHAHSFGVVYTLPVPLWLYEWGAAATLILSFVVVGVVASDRGTANSDAAHESTVRSLPSALRLALQVAAVAALLLTIATGLFGTPNPYGNFNMTFFWIVFLLAYAYLTAIIGNLYAAVNPWRTLTALIPQSGWIRAPRWLGYWPALILFGGLIWLELFGGTDPATLSYALIAYTAVMFCGVVVFGSAYWWRYGDLFGVFLRMIGKMAPVDWESASCKQADFRMRKPFAGLLDAPPTHWTALLFVLFMLSATAFDGLHESKPWREVFWIDLYQSYLHQFVGTNPFVAFPQMREWWQLWQRAALLLSPWVYLLVYLLGICGVWLIAGRREPLMTTAKRFAWSLLPIVLVYHITHYYTLIETQGVKITALVSDPFAKGWDLFGTADWYQRTIVPDLATVWHVQVGLIVLGHVISVYIAHVQALRWLGSRRLAALSQLPMLALMVGFTVAGLWILAQPIVVGS